MGMTNGATEFGGASPALHDYLCFFYVCVVTLERFYLSLVFLKSGYALCRCGGEIGRASCRERV